MLEPIGRSAGCPGIRGQCVNAKSDQRARGNRKRPSGSGPQRQAFQRALIPKKLGVTGSPRHHPANRKPRQAPHPSRGKPQPATALQAGTGFSRECDHPRGIRRAFQRDVALQPDQHVRAGDQPGDPGCAVVKPAHDPDPACGEHVRALLHRRIQELLLRRPCPRRPGRAASPAASAWGRRSAAAPGPAGTAMTRHPCRRSRTRRDSPACPAP